MQQGVSYLNELFELFFVFVEPLETTSQSILYVIVRAKKMTPQISVVSLSDFQHVPRGSSQNL